MKENPKISAMGGYQDGGKDVRIGAAFTVVVPCLPTLRRISLETSKYVCIWWGLMKENLRG